MKKDRNVVEGFNEELFEKINVPGDGSCLFWAVALAYLIPVRCNDEVFHQRIKNLFGDIDDTKLRQVQGLIKTYDPSLNGTNVAIFKNEELKKLVTGKFRRKVVDEMDRNPDKFKESITVNSFFDSRNGIYITNGDFQHKFIEKFKNEINQHGIDIEKLKPGALNATTIGEIDKELNKVQNKDKVKKFKFETYLECMRDSEAWGGEHEIKAMEQMLNTKILVFSGGHARSTHNGGDGQIVLFHDGAHYNFGLIKAKILQASAEEQSASQQQSWQDLPENSHHVDSPIERPSDQLESIYHSQSGSLSETQQLDSSGDEIEQSDNRSKLGACRGNLKEVKCGKRFYEHDLGDSESPLRKKFNAIIKDLEENKRTHQGSIKLISSKGGIKYLRAKLSDKDRLLFTQIKHNNKDVFVMLEVILNHDYENSYFLSSKDKTKNIEIEEMKITEEGVIERPSNDVSTVEIKDLERAHWLGKLVTFSATQEDIVKRAEECRLPLIISGAAGSGKTSVALESLRKMKEKFKGGKILYITKSENLIKESKKLFEDTDKLETRVQDGIDFLSVHEFFKRLIEDVKGKRPIDRNKFFSWFNKKCKEGKFKEYRNDGDRIFEEFTAVIGGGGLLGKDGKDRYAKLGERQSIFSRDKRNSIYAFFEEYRKFIENDPEYYDPNLVAHRCNKEEISAYDALVIDEVQDLTESTLGLILKSLKDESKDNFLLCGDINQVIHPSFFSLSKLRSFLCQNKYIENKGPEVFYTLEKNYRNSEQVIELANRILHFKNCCFASEDKMTADRKEAFFMKSDTGNAGNVDFVGSDKEQEIAKKVTRSINWAILALDDESKKGVSELFDTPLVFSIHEAKGLEFENVILYRFMSHEHYNELWKIVCPDKSKVQNVISEIRGSYNKRDIKTSRTKDKGNKSFEKYKFIINALYVAVTRAISRIYIVDDEKKCNLLKVIKPKGIDNVDIRDEKSSHEEWRDMALKLIDNENIEQAEDIAKKLLREGAKEYSKEIRDALEAKGYRAEAQEIKSSLDKDELEQAVKSFSELKISTENPSSQSPKKRKGKRRKASEDQKSNPMGDDHLMDIVRNDEIDQFKEMDISQYDEQKILDLALECSSLHIADHLILNNHSLRMASYLAGVAVSNLFKAAFHGHVGVVKLLLDHRANVHAMDEEGFTPLHEAAEKGHEGVVEVLIANKADVNAKTKEDGTPLHIATQEGHASVVEFLLKHGAEVDAKNKEGSTPLHGAAFYGHGNVVELLLKHGADVNAKDKEGFTPLKRALMNSRSEIVGLLLADPNINTGCIDLKYVGGKREDKMKLVQKRIQDNKLFDKVKEAAEEKEESKLDKLLKEIEGLLKPKYGFKPSLNYSEGVNDKRTTIEIAIESGGKLLQLLYDYAEKNIGVDTKIFKQLKDAKEQQENSQPTNGLCDISVSGRLTPQRSPGH